MVKRGAVQRLTAYTEQSALRGGNTLTAIIWAASRRRCSAAACSRVALARRVANNGLVVLFDGHDALLLVFELIVEWKERDVLAGQGRQFLLERLGVEVRIDEMYVFAVPRLG